MDEQFLVFGSKLLENGLTFSDYNIYNGSTLELGLRLLGAGVVYCNCGKVYIFSFAPFYLSNYYFFSGFIPQ